MGSHNRMYGNSYPKFKENICPLCNGTAETKGFELYQPAVDAFHYKCQTCNPNVIIGITGSALSSGFFKKVESDEYIRNALINKIKSKTSGEAVIYEKDIT